MTWVDAADYAEARAEAFIDQTFAEARAMCAEAERAASDYAEAFAWDCRSIALLDYPVGEVGELRDAIECGPEDLAALLDDQGIPCEDCGDLVPGPARLEHLCARCEAGRDERS